MKNFRIQKDKKLWGVLGKQKEYYHPNQFVARIVPLNANPLDAWDTKRSRYKRIDGFSNDDQQAGVVPEVSSGPSISPSPTPTLTNTPTTTSSPTPTPSITPSSTPYPLPINPSLWWDASDSSTFTLISSGGTNYVSRWNSKGSSTWALTGASTDTMPILSASTLMPGNPNCVRFTPNTTTTLRDYLTSFNNTPINHSGGTWFYIWAKPSGSTYANALYTAAVYSGLSNGGVVQIAGGAFQDRQFLTIQNTANLQNTYSIGTFAQASALPVYSATGLNDKYIMSFNFQANNGEFSNLEINQSAQTYSTVFTGTSLQPQVNSFIMGTTITTSAGTLNNNNSNVELCEAMWFNTNLTPAQREQVELYLKDKWRYDEWASPVPTPTPTASTTQTPTPSLTPTMTNTPTTTTTSTPTPSVAPFTPSSLSPDVWVDFSDSSSMTIRTSGSNSFIERINNKGTDVALTAYTQTTAGNQPQVRVSTVFTGLTISAATVSNDWLSGVATLSGFSWTIVYVIGRKLGDGTPILQPSRFTWAGNSFSPYWMDTSTNTVVRNFVGGNASYTVTNPNTITYTGQTYLQYISTTGASATAYIEMNSTGLTITQSNYFSGVFPAATSWLLNEDGEVSSKNGEVGEIIMLRRELTSTEKTNLYNYLKTKWGLTY
jgi:hypothetical protein